MQCSSVVQYLLLIKLKYNCLLKMYICLVVKLILIESSLWKTFICFDSWKHWRDGRIFWLHLIHCYFIHIIVLKYHPHCDSIVLFFIYAWLSFTSGCMLPSCIYGEPPDYIFKVYTGMQEQGGTTDAIQVVAIGLNKLSAAITTDRPLTFDKWVFIYLGHI